MSRPAIGCRARAGARHGAGREETSLVWSAEIGTGGEGGGRGGGNGEREEGVRACDWAGRNAFGARVSTGRCIIYNGNTIESMKSTIHGRKELGYLADTGFSAYLFFLFIAPL
jgi:hypothetical protein